MRQKQREDDQEGLLRMDANDEKGVLGTLDDELGATDNVQVVLDGEGLQGMDDDIAVKEIDRKQREDDQEGLPRMDGDDEKGVPAGILDDELGAADNSQVVLDDEGLQGMKDDIAVNELDQVVTYEATPDEIDVVEILPSIQLSYDPIENSVPRILIVVQGHCYALGGLQVWFWELSMRVLDSVAPEQLNPKNLKGADSRYRERAPSVALIQDKSSLKPGWR
ncbi:hypothetical protein FEM48_Zijuj02G0007500 [Ziziphus jujuba var. spinosa]|uniref:Uncharacterized protein n=1 Tax=Ziziphus jujuba var. spinosa TaxID=714518 RepID=A0A978VSL9_ZIZJJ|nr:hypothetical protein FEM48_Zijuj02G0007500 [Ziziphus jujuba var. spinosa]